MTAREAVQAAANLRVARLGDVRAACDKCGAKVFDLVLHDIFDVGYTSDDVTSGRLLSNLLRKLVANGVAFDSAADLIGAVDLYRSAVVAWVDAVSKLDGERKVGVPWQG